MSKLVLRDRIRIDALPEDVWPWIEDPERVMDWNPKLKAVEPITHGPRRLGYEYRAVYALGDRESEMSARFEEHQPPLRLAIRMTGGRLPPDGFCLEEYELIARGRTTRLRQKITVVNSGIPLVFRLLIKLVQFLREARRQFESAGAPRAGRGRPAHAGNLRRPPPLPVVSGESLSFLCRRVPLRHLLAPAAGPGVK